jgi:membrane protease YdiL (CAAX protease family)
VEPVQKSRLVVWLVAINIGLSLIDGFFKQSLYLWSPSGFFAYDVFHKVLLPGASFAWILRYGEISLHEIGLAKPGIGPGQMKLGPMVVASVVLWLLLDGIYYVSEDVISRVLWKFDLLWWSDFQWDTTLKDSAVRPLQAMYYAMTAGLVEEVLFRGLLFWMIVGKQVQKARCRRYLWLSSLLFALTHWEQGSSWMLAAGIFGFGAAWAFLRIGSLWPLIGAHVLADLVAFW